MTFPEKSTAKDLSDTPEAQAFPAYYSSMAGGNTITEKNPHFAGHGEDSEATHDVVAKSITWTGVIHDVPVLPGPSDESHVETDEKGSGYSPAAHVWKEI
jgi:hypothetical protein